MDFQIGALSLEAASNLSFKDQYAYFNRFIDHNLSSNATKAFSKGEKKAFSKASESLDKYYTKQNVADQCYTAMKALILDTGMQAANLLFIEPSAGSGVFLNSIQEQKIGFDIAPTKDSLHEILQNDFLKDDLLELLSTRDQAKQLVFIGNPPFGKKSKLAVEFINRSLGYSNIVGFIVPVQFRKWSAQSAINSEAKLVLDLDLQEDAFEFMGKNYKIRCCFQVWVLDSFSPSMQDFRIKEKPSTNHPDFEMYQYNRTEQAKKFFEYDWDFAVPRQGYLDYSTRAFHKDQCDPKQQWIFFKAKSKKVLKKLLNIDYSKLSKKNIGMPGFGKADVIQEYIKL